MYGGLLGSKGIILVQGLSSHPADVLFSIVTDIGIDMAYLLLPILYWLWSRKKAAALGVLLLLSAYVNSFLKYLISTPRPSAPGIRILRHESSPSFPSGHSQASVTFWGYLAFLVNRWWAWVAAGAVVFLVGLSRVYLGAHYPADVIGGWGIGISILLIGIWATRTGCCVRLESSVSWVWLSIAVIAASVFLALVHPRIDGRIPEEVSRLGSLSGLLVGLFMADAKSLPDRLKGSLLSRTFFVAAGLALMAATAKAPPPFHPPAGSVTHVGVLSARWFVMSWEVAFLIPWISNTITKGEG